MEAHTCASDVKGLKRSGARLERAADEAEGETLELRQQHVYLRLALRPADRKSRLQLLLKIKLYLLQYPCPRQG
jgi:hypothetical protein